MHASALSIIAAGIAFLLAVTALTRRGSPASIPFALALLAATLWLFFNGLEKSAITLQDKIYFARFQYLGIPYIGPMWLVFVWAYLRQSNWNSPRRLVPLLAIPVTGTLLALTNEAHHLVWTSAYLVPGDPSRLAFDHGVWFWLILTENYVCILFAIFWLGRALWRYPQLYRRQMIALMAGAFLPVVGNAIDIAGLSPIKGLELTPLAFVFSGLIYIFVVFHLHLLRLVPVVREALIEDLSDAVLVLDNQDQVVDINQAACALFGVSQDQVIGKPIAALAPVLVKFRASREVVEEICQGDEKPAYLDLRVTPLRDSSKRLTGRLLVLHDVTARKQAQLEMERLYHIEQQRVLELNAVRSITMDLSAEFDLEELLGRILARALELLEVKTGELGLYNAEKDCVEVLTSYGMERSHTGEALAMGEGVMGTVAQNRQPLLVEDYASWANRSAKYAEINHFTTLGVPLLAGGELLGVIVAGDERSHRTFTEHELDLFNLFAQEAALAIHNARLFDQMKTLASHDTLTGVYNRRSFFQLAAIEVERAMRYNKPLAAIMLDIDKFKRVNDTFGHAAGDLVLQSIAHLCVQSIRKVDVIGRYGGEEFAIILPETDLAQAGLIAERLCSVIAGACYETPRGEVCQTASLGVSALDRAHPDLDALLDQADQALYLAKQSRNAVRIYER